MKRLLFLIICLFIFAPIIVEARTCEYGLPSPPIYYNGSWAYGQTIKLKTSASSCLAKNMSVYFSTGNYIANMGFHLDGYLMEEDYNGNAHDLAKVYLGYNTGYDLMNWSVVRAVDDNLDSAGDQTCELYMKFRLTEPIAQNNFEYFSSDMFRYTICMD